MFENSLLNKLLTERTTENFIQSDTLTFDGSSHRGSLSLSELSDSSDDMFNTDKINELVCEKDSDLIDLMKAETILNFSHIESLVNCDQVSEFLTFKITKLKYLTETCPFLYQMVNKSKINYLNSAEVNETSIESNLEITNRSKNRVEELVRTRTFDNSGGKALKQKVNTENNGSQITKSSIMTNGCKIAESPTMNNDSQISKRSTMKIDSKIARSRTYNRNNNINKPNESAAPVRKSTFDTTVPGSRIKSSVSTSNAKPTRKTTLPSSQTVNRKLSVTSGSKLKTFIPPSTSALPKSQISPRNEYPITSREIKDKNSPTSSITSNPSDVKTRSNLPQMTNTRSRILPRKTYQ